MKELLKQMAAYNTWANKKLAETLLHLSEAQQQQELPSSFSSLYKTLLHMWDAESGWWQRLKLNERVVFPREYFTGTLPELISEYSKQNQLWEEWIGQASEAALEHVFMYHSTKREPFKQPVYQMLLHVFNHGTYHRGQLVNLLRQLGVTKIPQTDFIIWSRKK
jgi:uncharacterized damage-inducible protein DinB